MSDSTVTAYSPPQQLTANLFVVYGSIKLNPLVQITRNMAIVRHGDELTLINPVRMREEGLAQLEALGKVAHVLRLGPLHGLDDEFYVSLYGARFWALPGGTTYTTPAIDHALAESAPLPFPDARLFVFDHMTEAEGAILLEGSPGVLLTTDAVQSYSTAPHKPHTNLLARLMLPLMGFPNRTILGPIWMKIMVTDRDGMRREFERLLELDFDQLLSAHGVFLAQNAKAEVRAAYEATFSGSA